MRFTSQSGLTFGICGERRRKDLDCDVTPQTRVTGRVHDAHPALAKNFSDRVWTELCAWKERHHLLSGTWNRVQDM
jgi:hypothetical protein